MSPPGVVEPLDVIENIRFGLVPGLVGGPGGLTTTKRPGSWSRRWRHQFFVRLMSDSSDIIHCHLLVLDGVYVRGNDQLEFRRVGRHLHRRGWLTRDVESSHLTLDRDGTTRRVE